MAEAPGDDTSQQQATGKFTREYVLIKSKYADIIEKLSAKRAAEVLSGKLFQAGMITKDMLDEAELSTVIQSKRVRPLVSAILAMVKTDKEKYQEFIAILRKTDGLSDIAAFIEEYSKSKDVFLPECVSGTIERYLPKCEEQWKVNVNYHEKERKLAICAGSEEECSKVKEWFEQKIFPLVLEFPPVCTRFLQTPYTSIKLKRTPQHAASGFAWFTAENLGIHSAAEGVIVNKDKASILKASIYADDYTSIHKDMTELLEKLKPYQHSLKVGYEARFGRVHWKFPLQQQTDAEVSTLVCADKTFFEARISENIQKLLELTTCTTSPVKLLDPLKVIVTTDDDDTLYEVVAVVDEQKDGRFALNRVYYAQPGGRVTCDIVFPNKKYDIRIASNYAPVVEEEIDCKVHKTIEDMVKKIITTRENGIEMPVQSKNHCVKFMRRKTQLQHKLKERPEWILAEYHVQEFAMDGRAIDKWKRAVEEWKKGDVEKWKKGDVEKWKIGYVQEIKFKKEKTEIELWSQKWFPDSTDKSRFTRDHCCNLKSTGNVPLPFGDKVVASSWTVESFMESFEDFVRTSVDIVDILSS